MLRLWFFLLFVVLVPSSAFAKPLPTCKTPRNAVESVFNWQLGKQQSLVNASRCFERSGRSQKKLEEVARRLKTIFHAEGTPVASEKISDDPDFIDENKNPHVVVHPRYPRIVVEKRGGEWVWTRETLDWIDDRYEDRFGWLDRAIDAIPDALCVTYADVAIWQYGALAVLLVLGVVVSRVLRWGTSAWLRRSERRVSAEAGLLRRLIDRSATASAVAVSALMLRALYPELRLPVEIASTLHTLVRLMLTVAGILAAFRFADVFADGLRVRADKTETRLDDHLVPIIRKGLKVGSIFVGFLVLLNNLGVDVTALFATLGIGTLAIGLAAKDTIANLLGSISIFIDNPFKIGDWIHVDGVDGVVEEVGFRSTRIRTFYNTQVVLPNAKLADQKIDNYGKRWMRRCIFALHVAQGTRPEDLEALCREIHDLVASSDRVQRERVEVVLSGISSPAIEILVTFFFLGDDYAEEPREKHEIVLRVLRRIGERGIALHAPAAPPLPVSPPPSNGPMRR